jgi:uncharacterized protein (DUF58 family)
VGLGGVRLTRRGVVMLAASAVAFMVAYALGFRQLLYVATALAALPLIALLLIRVRRPRLSVIRSFSPHVVEAGSMSVVSLLVHNLGAAPTLRAICWDEAPWVESGSFPIELPVMQQRGLRFTRRGNTVRLEYELRPPRRGIHPIGPFVIQLGDAFGLVTTAYTVGQRQDLIVTPEVVALPETGLSISAGDGESRLVQRRSSGDDDDSMTREYRAGDAMRRVHWRASARHGDLMVRQEEQRSFPEARVILDTRGIGYDDLYGDERTGVLESDCFEWAVRMLASVTVHLRRYGFHVTVAESGSPQLEIGLSRRHRRLDDEFLAELAELRLTISSWGASELSGSMDKGRGSNGPIIAIAAAPDAQTLEWMLGQRRPGDVAVAFLVQPVSTADSPAHSAAARESYSLAATSERLTNAGWLVVSVRSDDDHAAAWDSVALMTGRSSVGY